MRTIILTIVFIFSLTTIFAQAGNTKLTISHLTGDFYIYTTYNTYQESQVPANGMYLITDNGVVMFDPVLRSLPTLLANQNFRVVVISFQLMTENISS